MGGSSTTNNTTTNSKSQVTIPAEIRKRGSQLSRGAMRNYFDPGKKTYNYADHSQVGQDTTGQLNQYHNQAGQNFQNASTSYQPYINRADQTATQSAQNNNAQGVSGPNYNYANIQQFQNPHTQGVIDRGIRDIGDALNTQRLNNQSRAAMAGAFGGARHGVIDAESQATAAQTMSDFVGNQLNTGFNQAVNQYNTDFGQNLQATQLNNQAAQQNWAKDAALSQIYSNLGQQRQTQDINAGQANLNFGNTIMDQEQRQKDNAYNLGYMGPMGVYERLAAINAMQPHNRTSTTSGTQTATSQQQGGWIGPALGAAGQFAVAMSDERTKENVEERDPEDVLGAFSGITPVTYTYKEEAREKFKDLAPAGERRGFMAQDLERHFKRKSGPTIGGYKSVDYGNVIGDLVAAVKGLEARTRKLRKA